MVGYEFFSNSDKIIGSKGNLSSFSKKAIPPFNLLVDGSMEFSDTSLWTQINNADITKETGSPRLGLRSLKVAYDGSSNPAASQTILTIGETYRVVGYARSDGAKYPRIRTPIASYWQGTLSTNWQKFDFEFVADNATIMFQCATTGAGFGEFDACGVYSCASGSGLAPDSPTEVFIVAGQSNMYGLTSFVDMPEELELLPRDNIEMWVDGSRRYGLNEATSWGPEASLIHGLSPIRGGKLLFIKRAYPATSLYACWRPGGWDAGRGAVTGELEATYQYTSLVSDITTAIDGRAVSKITFCFLQGERDGKLEVTADDYADGLDNLLTQLQIDIGLTIDYAVIGRVRPFPIGTYPYKSTVRAAQDATLTTKPGGVTCISVDLDSVDPDDELHYSAAGYVDTGNRFVTSCTSVITGE